MQCPNCQADLPEGSRFCVECGVRLESVATGPTVKLDEASRQCSGCGAVSPVNAAFCMNCGRALEAPASARLPQAGAPLAQPISVNPPPVVLPPTQHSTHTTGWPRMHRQTAEGVQGGLFLIGLALLFFSGWFWPGILVLVGLTALVEDLKKGRPGEGLGGMVFMCGLAFLFASDWFWPGILVLMGIMAILSPLFKR